MKLHTGNGNNFYSGNSKRIIVLGLHREPWHDTGASLIVEENSKTQLVSISQERLDRIKHSRAYPKEAVEYCMNELGVNSIDEIDLVVSDYIKFPVWNRDYNNNSKKNYHPILDGVRNSAETNHFNFPIGKIAIINHHQAHAAAAFYASPFEESAVLVVDGNGSEMETQSLFFASKKNGIILLEKSFVLGLGQLYSSVTKKIGFGLLNEGKTMGLAPFGKDTFSNKDLIDWKLKKYDGIHTDYSAICDWYYEVLFPLPPIDEKIKDRLSYEVQCECEMGMVHLAEHAKKVTNSNNLCISGGVGLNSISNYSILNKKIFDNIFIQPACSDSGISIGCAYHGYHQILKRETKTDFNYAQLGRRYSGKDIEKAVNSFSGYKIIKDNIIDETANLLVRNKVVGWFQGRSETGPRALGCRSILMSPCRAENKDILNSRVKHREPFRPFAPAVPEDKSCLYFKLDTPSPYMLLIAGVLEEARQMVPAITHVDGTARVQTVTAESNKKFYDLINSFGNKTGVYVLLNTSFNDNNEPIVETPEDAIRCMLKTGIDALCIGETLLIKETDLNLKKEFNDDEPEHPLSIEYAETLMEKKEYGKARDILMILLGKDDQAVDILNDLALLEILEEKFDTGINILNRVLELDSNNEIAMGNLQYLMTTKELITKT